MTTLAELVRIHIKILYLRHLVKMTMLLTFLMKTLKMKRMMILEKRIPQQILEQRD